MQRGELEEALELVNEWRMIDPRNADLVVMKMQIREKMEEMHAPRGGAGICHQSLSDVSFGHETDETDETNQSSSAKLSDVSFGHETDETDETQAKQKSKRPQIRASKQSSGAKPKSKKELQQQERQREKERQEIAQELEEKRRLEENKKESKADVQRDEEQQRTYEDSPGAMAAVHIPSSMTPPSAPTFPERSRKRKIRRKTRNLRARREGLDDDSDTSSICSISTCPGDLDHRRNSPYHPMMPTFQDSDQGVVSDQPKSSLRSTMKAAGTSSKNQSCAIRSRPPGIQGAYRLCVYHDRPQLCWQGKLCPYAHSEAERIAWKEERKKGTNKPTAKKKKLRKIKQVEALPRH
ncbi:hypothetical protein OS493_023631 [Desmophyllum pertusum]|uniref:C3H1-type domain-containing protein n=1 Tax=Desmophyllum pertusum TaxID=174260 RepID=A0A9W9ZAY5_9CNID|nr:hypothetical protein OS493_023631 [Desmophyllum pertusum]